MYVQRFIRSKVEFGARSSKFVKISAGVLFMVLLKELNIIALVENVNALVILHKYPINGFLIWFDDSCVEGLNDCAESDASVSWITGMLE